MKHKHKEIICIVCPKGCHLQVNEESMNVQGASCEKGIEYGLEEIRAPKRTLTSTVEALGGNVKRCPVRTREMVPKEKINDIMEEITSAKVKAPVSIGDVVIRNAAGTGVDVIATRAIETM